MTSASTERPRQRPPKAGTNGGATRGSAPTLTKGEVRDVARPAAPTLTPPAAGTQTAGAGGITATWHNNLTVSALWSIEETRNAFVHLDGLGWRKVYNGRDGAFLALLALAGQARQTGRPVNVREEADGMIYEIYLW